jgi:hypothetical protein
MFPVFVSSNVCHTGLVICKLDICLVDFGFETTPSVPYFWCKASFAMFIYDKGISIFVSLGR